jgi:hypothetical protein
MKRQRRRTTKGKPTILSLTRALRRTEREKARVSAGWIAERAKLDSPEFRFVSEIAQRWHYSEVRSIAHEAIKDLARTRGTIPMTEHKAREWLTERVNHEAQDHEHVIYPEQASVLLAASDNEEAYVEQGFGESADTSARARCALRADIWQLLEARSDEWEHDGDPEVAEDHSPDGGMCGLVQATPVNERDSQDGAP